jgi:hypothetical protein
MESLNNGQSTLTQENLLHRIATRIRQSLELKEILSATAAEVRSYLGTDRVKVYQFSPDGSGIVIAESIQADRLPSLLGLNFPADDIPPYARELFVRARQRAIVNLDSQEIGISPLTATATGELLEPQDIRYRPVDPCHVEYLTAMGVKSSVVVPIVLEGRETGKHQPPSLVSPAHLWGLLVSHHAEPRVVTEEELRFIQAVVDQVSVAIAQSILLDQVRQQAQQEAHINRVTALLCSSPTVQLQGALEEAVDALEGSGGRLYLLKDGNQAVELYTCGEQPQPLDHDRPIEENMLWQKYLKSVALQHPSGEKSWSVKWMRAVYELTDPPHESSEDHNLWAIADLYKEPLLRTIAPYFQQTKIRGLLIVPFQYGAQVLGCLTICRNEVDTEILWAGSHDPDTRQLMARQSFDAWRQIKAGHAPTWTEGEIKLAQALGERFSDAVKQYRLYQEVQCLNSQLEQQVHDRTEELRQSNAELQKSTAELQQAFDQQQTLSRIINKIRASLDHESIFRATTHELCQLLKSDRVNVYRFNSDWGGEFVSSFGSVKSDWTTVSQLETNMVWNDTHLQETQGGRYRHNETSVVHDIHQVGYAPCHIQLLEKFQIKAMIIAPIFVGQDLWGLLAVYQHKQPRHWEKSEVEFTMQIAAQLGIALQHAVLLECTRSQAQKLSEAIEHLKETQTHLIHSEKMSSLGQLVAGVAHEINNPVNFIYGNLTPINEYIENLLMLLELYQKHYPDPDDAIVQQAEATDLDFIAEDLPRLFSSLRVGADRIREIVLSLRNFSRLDQSEVKRVDIHEGIDSTLMILQHRVKPSHASGGIAILKHYGELPPVECFAGQLNQVFMNLISNAIDAIQEYQSLDTTAKFSKGTVTITTQYLDSEQIRISIKDTGKGIAENAKSKLFDPFFTTKPIGKGTGLGLSISYQIIEKHGGKLWYESQVGEGTEFIIEIPVKQTAFSSSLMSEESKDSPTPLNSALLNSTPLNSMSHAAELGSI